MRSFQLLSLAAIATLVFSFGPPAHATTITAGATTMVASGGMAPGSPVNYDFFDFGENQPVRLTNFSVSQGDASQYAGNGLYSNVIAPDGTGPFMTGVAYYADNGTHVMATFTASVPNFTVWLLSGNADLGFVTDSSVGLGVNGGSAVTTAVTPDVTINEFTAFYVTGATPGDIFQVYATGTNGVFGYNTDETNLGGLTFATPEPSSLVLLGTGLLGGLGGLRRKFLKA